MDVLETLLEGPRARGAFLLRAIFDPPWSLRIEDETPVALMAMLQGYAYLLPDGAPPVHVPQGHVAIVRGPDHYVVADRPETPPQVVVYPGGRCTSAADGRALWDEQALGIRTWGDPAGSTVMLIGSYEGQSEASRPLLSALPSHLVLSPDGRGRALLDVLTSEVQVDAPGQRALLDRLLDALLISTLRSWFTDQAEQGPGWFRAQSDPAVGAAIALLHQHVAHPWTVEELSSRVGVSRASLGRRFTRLVGESPISYLTGWRLALAADEFAGSDATVASIARRLGYATPFSLSAAFKRAYGISPQEYRSGRPLRAAQAAPGRAEVSAGRAGAEDGLAQQSAQRLLQ